MRGPDIPQLVRRIHPDLHHPDEGPHDVRPRLRLGVVRSTAGLDSPLLPLQLPGEDVDGALVVPQREPRIVFAQLREIQMRPRGRYGRGPGVWRDERFERLPARGVSTGKARGLEACRGNLKRRAVWPDVPPLRRGGPPSPAARRRGSPSRRRSRARGRGCGERSGLRARSRIARSGLGLFPGARRWGATVLGPRSCFL